MNKTIWLLLIILFGCTKKVVTIEPGIIPFKATAKVDNEPLQIKQMDNLPSLYKLVSDKYKRVLKPAIPDPTIVISYEVFILLDC